MCRRHLIETSLDGPERDTTERKCTRVPSIRCYSSDRKEETIGDQDRKRKRSRLAARPV